MDSFTTDNTEVLKMKQNYDRFLMEEDSIVFGNTRHNLLQDFEETPARSMKQMNNSSRKRSYTSISADVKDETSELRKQRTSWEADIITLKANITQMEARISSMEVSASKTRIDYDQEIMKFKTEKDREASKAQEMRSKLHYLMEKQQNSQEEIKRLEEELRTEKCEMEKKMLAAQREKFDISEKAQKAKTAWFYKESELHDQIMSQKKQISDLQTQLEESQTQMELQKRLQVENSEQKRELELLKASLQEQQQKNRELEQQLLEHGDNLVITRVWKDDLDLVPSMKSELEKLRLDNEQLRYNEQNTLLLEEEVISLKKKLEFLTSAQERLTQLEVENEELQGRLQRWEMSDTSGSRRPQSPSSFSRRIQELEAQQAHMMLTQGQLQTSLNSTQRRLDQALVENHRLSAELLAEKNMKSQTTDRSKHLQRKLLLVTKERDSYRGLLDAYENEVTINFDAEKKAQIQHLESVLQGYKEENTALEIEMNKLYGELAEKCMQCSQLQQQLEAATSSAQQTSCKEDKDLIRQLQERVSELETLLETVEQQKNILEARIEQRHLQGDYDPSKTKIVHLTANPCAVAQSARVEELKRLKEENEKLKKRNQILEERGGHVEDITIQVQEKLQHPSPSKEVEDMKAQLQREEMRNKRLMEVFKKTSQEFREVCYQLTGYKIDIPCSNQYRLTSMYADSPKDYFLFQQNSQNEIQMLQTDFSMTVQDAMEMYLQRQNSIPMFLSHITMELFSRQTMNLG